MTETVSASNNSRAAAAWAAKRKEQVAKAEQLRETRRQIDGASAIPSYQRPAPTLSDSARSGNAGVTGIKPLAADAAQRPERLPEHNLPRPPPRAEAAAARTDYKELTRRRFAEAEAAIAHAERSAIRHLENMGYPPEASSATSPWRQDRRESPTAHDPRGGGASMAQQQQEFQERLKRHEEHLQAMRSGRAYPDSAQSTQPVSLPPWTQQGAAAGASPPGGRAQINWQSQMASGSSKPSSAASSATIGWAGPWTQTRTNTSDRMYPAAQAAGLHDLPGLQDFDPTAGVRRRLDQYAGPPAPGGAAGTQEQASRQGSACQWSFAPSGPACRSGGGSLPPGAPSTRDRGAAADSRRRPGAGEPSAETSADAVRTRTQQPLFRPEASPRVPKAGRRASAPEAAADAADDSPADRGTGQQRGLSGRPGQTSSTARLGMRSWGNEEQAPLRAASHGSPPDSSDRASSDIASSMQRLRSLQQRRAASRVAAQESVAAVHSQQPDGAGQEGRTASEGSDRHYTQSDQHRRPGAQSPSAQPPQQGRLASFLRRSSHALLPGKYLSSARRQEQGTTGARGSESSLDSELEGRQGRVPADANDIARAARDRRQGRAAQNAPPEAPPPAQQPAGQRSRTSATARHDDEPASAGAAPTSNDVFAALLAAELADGAATSHEPLQQCSTCGRSFTGAALAKHAKICQKVFVQKRKQFDMTAARTAGLDDQPSRASAPQRGKPAREKQPTRREDMPIGKKNPAWKQKSNALRAAMMANRQIAEAQSKGEDIRNLPVYQDEVDNRVPCPHCGRKFEETVAERHIPKCKDIKAKPSFLKAGGGAGGGRLAVLRKK